MLTFSQAILADVPAIVNMVNRAYSTAPDASGWAGERSFQPGDRTDAFEVQRLIASAASVLIVGRRDGLLNSCCSITRRSADTVYLGLFAVEPDKQSGGAGRQTTDDGVRRVPRPVSLRGVAHGNRSDGTSRTTPPVVLANRLPTHRRSLRFSPERRSERSLAHPYGKAAPRGIARTGE